MGTAASPESVRTAVILSGLGMLALALLGLFGGVVTMKTSANVSQRFAYRLRGDMYRKISHFSFKNIDQFSTASLTTRMTNDVTTLQNVVMMCLRILVRVPALAVVAACFAVSINPKMSAMLLILLPILIVVVACILKFGFLCSKNAEEDRQRKPGGAGKLNRYACGQGLCAGGPGERQIS